MQENSIQVGEISMIIPVKDNQRGVDYFLRTFFETHSDQTYPGEIILVDNNSKTPLRVPKEIPSSAPEIQLIKCVRPGPAAARNEGAKKALGKWLLFVDSDCIPTKSMITGYLQQDRRNVGFQGFVGALGKDYVSRYYESQGIHQPPHKTNELGEKVPKYLVTANILIRKDAFEEIQGMDESYSFAGEDIDFGSRLSSVGTLAYARDSVVLHNFEDGFWGLVVRFVKYGKGNRLAQQKLKIPLYPFPFTAKNKKVLVNHFLAIVQWLCLLLGFSLKSIQILVKKS